jgi:hypothetical protein
MRKVLLLIDPTHAERAALAGAECFESDGTTFLLFVEPPLNVALLRAPTTVRLPVGRVMPFEGASWADATEAAAAWAFGHGARLARERAARLLIH